MKYTELGKSGITISTITHGCMELGGGRWKTLDAEHNAKLLRIALDHGVTTFDTAEGYGGGRSEEIVGEALKDRRKNCVIATKVSKEHLRAADVKKAAEGSLKRLGTDYIDLLYIHWPNPDIPLSETMPAFAQLKQEGKIRAIGVSNFDVPLMREAMQYAPIDALQPEYNLLERNIERDVLGFCAEHQISVLSYNSIAKGILSGAFHFGGAKLEAEDFRNEKPLFQPENLERELPLLSLLRDIAAQHKASLSQVAIAWVLRQKGMSSAIVGTQNHQHFADNIEAVSVELSDADLARLNAASDTVIRALT